jgi:uncharacterized Zn-binding protein involved in type VI secretion
MEVDRRSVKQFVFEPNLTATEDENEGRTSTWRCISYGGKVVVASGTAFVGGIAVARQGNACVCQVSGHAICTIVEGAPMILLEGILVAFEWHRTAYGTTIIFPRCRPVES